VCRDEFGFAVGDAGGAMSSSEWFTVNVSLMIEKCRA
jgi:hypothetical protein